jgi:hypothetical protein
MIKFEVFTLKMEAEKSSETLELTAPLHGVTSKKAST